MFLLFRLLFSICIFVFTITNCTTYNLELDFHNLNVNITLQIKIEVCIFCSRVLNVILRHIAAGLAAGSSSHFEKYDETPALNLF